MDLPPLALIELAIEPNAKADQEKLAVALSTMVAEDPVFTVYAEQESGVTIMKGVSESHLDAKVEILRQTYKIDATIGAPQVAYRETLGCNAEVDFTHARVVGPKAEFARVKILFEPGETGSGFVFKNFAVGGAVPEAFIPGVARGLQAAKVFGLLAGFPVIDFKATLIDGAYHDIDSSVLSFEIASRAAFKALRECGSPKLLEPIMKVEVVTSGDDLGEIIRDLTSRRGKVKHTDNAPVITALVPLASMFGYAGNLRGMNQGRAHFTMQFDHYGPVLSPDDGPTYRPAIGMRA